MATKWMKKICLAIIICAPMLDGVYALEYNYTIYAVGERSDNIQQTAQSPSGDMDQEGSIYTGGIRFDLETERNRSVVTSLNGNLSRTAYSIDELEAESRNQFDGSILYQPASSNFRLAIVDRLQQTPEDRTSPQDVNNSADVNTFSITPSYALKFSKSSDLNVAYSWIDVTSDLENTSREIDAVNVSLRRQINDLLNLSINVGESTTIFDDDEREFGLEAAFLRLLYDADAFRYSIDVGKQRITDVEDSDTPYAAISFGRRINNSSDITLTYRQGFGETINFDINNTVTRTTVNDQSGLIDTAIKQKQASIDYNYTSDSFLRWQFSLFRNDLESEDLIVSVEPTDETVRGARITADYRFNSGNVNSFNYGISLGYRYTETEFKLTGQDNSVKEANIRFNYFPSRQITSFFEIFSRNTNESIIESGNEELRIRLGIEWSPTQRQ